MPSVVVAPLAAPSASRRAPLRAPLSRPCTSQSLIERLSSLYYFPRCIIVPGLLYTLLLLEYYTVSGDSNLCSEITVYGMWFLANIAQ